MLFGYYPVLMPIALCCIVFAAVVATDPAIFQQQIIADIQIWYESGDWAGASQVILPKIFILISIYVVSIIAITVQTQLMAYITQGFLSNTQAVQNLCHSYQLIRWVSNAIRE